MPWSVGRWWGALALVGMACTRDNPAYDDDGGGPGPTGGPATTEATTTGPGPTGEEADVGETTGGGSSMGGSDDAPVVCVGHDDCSDGSFCNGIEVCDPGRPGANELGCLPSSGNPCLDGMECDDERGTCVTICGEDPDVDDDGMDAVECGGTDCNDAAPGYGLGDWAHCGACNQPCGELQACSQAGMCIAARRVFVTSVRYTGNLGGLVGGD
jgi:hypothetical protein